MIQKVTTVVLIGTALHSAQTHIVDDGAEAVHLARRADGTPGAALEAAGAPVASAPGEPPQ